MCANHNTEAHALSRASAMLGTPFKSLGLNERLIEFCCNLGGACPVKYGSG